MDTVNTDMLRGRVDIIVLNALSEKDGYGYDILNYIQTRTEGHYEMKQSSIYSVLKRLEKLGQISSYAGGDETNGAKRRYYSLTDSGRLILENEKKEWNYTRTLLDNLVSDVDFDLLNDTPPFKPSDLRPLTKRVAVTADKTDEEEEKTIVKEDTVIPAVIKNQETPIEAVIPLAKKQEDLVGSDNFNETYNGRNINYEEASDEPVTTFSNNYDIAHSNPSFLNNINKTFATQVPLTTVGNSNHSTNAATDRLFDNNRIENAPKETPIDFDKLYNSKPVEKQNLNLYKDVLGSIFKTDAPKYKPDTQESFENIDCKYIYDLKAVLKNEGHRLKEYSPTAKKSAIKYLSLNKLIRDSLFISFLFYVITILVLFLTRSYFEISKTTLYVLGGLGIIAPIAALIIYYQNPANKKKDTVNVKLIIYICLIVYLAAFMINLVIALIVPSGYSLNSLHIYVPSFLLLAIPFFGIIFTVLYKSTKYHLN